jgi:hypothetical protein
MRSRTGRSYLGIAPDAEASALELQSLSREFHDCVHMTSQYQPLLVPHELSPIVAPLAEELQTASTRDPSDPSPDTSMLQVTHVPFVTISDINKMEDARYLHNIRDLTLQIRLYSGHPMRQNGSIMTYLGNKLEDQFSPDTALEESIPLQLDTRATLVAVRLCQAHLNDQLLYNLMQRVR